MCGALARDHFPHRTPVVSGLCCDLCDIQGRELVSVCVRLHVPSLGHASLHAQVSPSPGFSTRQAHASLGKSGKRPVDSLLDWPPKHLLFSGFVRPEKSTRARRIPLTAGFPRIKRASGSKISVDTLDPWVTSRDTPRPLITTSRLGLEPAPYTRRWLRKRCTDPCTRPEGAFRLPGRGGWAITVEDWEAYLRSSRPGLATTSIEEYVRARYITAA